MSSAQVLPSSRKQELQEAGRRKLEEFRKKKAAKKAPSNIRNQRLDGEIGRPATAESDGAVILKSNGPVEGNQSPQENIRVSSSASHSTAPSPGNNPNLSNPVQIDTTSQEIKIDNPSGSLGVLYAENSLEAQANNDLGMHDNGQGVPPYATTTDYFSVMDRRASQNFNSGYREAPSAEESGSSMNNSIGFSPEVSRRASGSSTPLFMSSEGHTDVSSLGLNSSREDPLQPKRFSQKELKDSELEGWKPVSAISGLYNIRDSTIRPPEPAVLNFDIGNSSPYNSVRSETSSRRSRSSFLDSLNVPKASSETHFQHSGSKKSSGVSTSAQLNGMAVPGSSSVEASAPQMFEQTENALPSISNGPRLAYDVFQPPKQNEDFAALEQHIEDLTQEKFSLQRALEASRALAESLAAENSSLTDSYNQQRHNVNQLKADMERLQQEIKAQLVELESVRHEYGNARLECNAADERGKILAAEVIGLEEKALRLRSNELKLERELENSQAEMSSYKKGLSSLERERQDLQSTINALQEEKKVLQTKLRKASSGGKSVDVGVAATSRKDTSTSTEDLESFNQEIGGSALVGSDGANSTVMSENDRPSLEVLAMNIPPDQMRMIHNINTLISELAMEKEELTQALSSELSQSAKLKELNKELSRKLEAQTQRLELLTAQSMVNDSALAVKQPDSRSIQDNAVYADEGDEVVERVLGWIMKLFPGGPSKRRTSKLL